MSRHVTVQLCARCRHPQDWHRFDDSQNIPTTSPQAKFRCIGYDCELPGPPPRSNPCDCPNWVESGPRREERTQ